MNCRDIETLLLAERDGVLTSDQHAALGAHLPGCVACRQSRDRLAEIAKLLNAEAAEVSPPDAEREWQAVQAKLNAPLAGSEVRRKSDKRRLAPVVWLAAPLAAAAAVLIAFLGPAASHGEAPVQVAQANYVEAGDATASTMVYVDKESGWLVVWASGDGTNDRG